jgi:hypothetical protein
MATPRSSRAYAAKSKSIAEPLLVRNLVSEPSDSFGRPRSNSRSAAIADNPDDALSEYQRVAGAADALFSLQRGNVARADAHWRRELIAMVKRRSTTG